MQPRPYLVTLLAIGVLTLAMVGLVRFGQALSLWEFLNSLDVSPVYLVISGLLIGLAGLLAVWGLWRGAYWSARYTIGYVSAVFLFYWVDRIFLGQSAIAKLNTPFSIGVTVIILAYTWFALFNTDSKSYFQTDLPKA